MSVLPAKPKQDFSEHMARAFTATITSDWTRDFGQETASHSYSFLRLLTLTIELG